MKWATKALLQIDRIASCWLILRFVDEYAQFEFVDSGTTPAADAIQFALPGAVLSHGSESPTTFQVIARTYRIADPAVQRLAGIIAAVAAHVLHGGYVATLASRNSLAAGVLAMAEGAMLLSATDAECLDRSLPIYDVLYARLQAEIAVEHVSARAPDAEMLAPATILDRCLLLAQVAAAMREARAGFSADEVERALLAVSTVQSS